MDDDPWMRDGGPAYPAKSPNLSYKGMTLRDRFAITALHAMRGCDGESADDRRRYARLAYLFADAMLEARKEK
jgi:hypothetical protein